MAERVLVIEDDPEIAFFERTILERAGYEVKVATTGAAGLEAEPGFHPAVILLDVELPDISGLDVCTSLANSSDAFILMVSAHSTENDVLKGLGLGADDYVRKPFSGNELVARVQSFLRRRERSRRSDADGRLQVGTADLVRDFHTLGRWSGEARQFRVRGDSLPPGTTDVAVIVQAQGQSAIIGAASVALN